MILETERLYLREMTQEDWEPLCEILQDVEVMYAYEHGFTDEEVQQWLDKQLLRYQNDGFGLWAVVEKVTNQMIGQCGLTWQPWGEQQVLEIGYLFGKKYWHQGYATEAAMGCKQYAFVKLGSEQVYSIIRDTNQASQRVAERNGMSICGQEIKQYYGMIMPHLVYSVKREGLPTNDH